MTGSGIGRRAICSAISRFVSLALALPAASPAATQEAARTPRLHRRCRPCARHDRRSTGRRTAGRPGNDLLLRIRAHQGPPYTAQTAHASLPAGTTRSRSGPQRLSLPGDVPLPSGGRRDERSPGGRQRPRVPAEDDNSEGDARQARRSHSTSWGCSGDYHRRARGDERRQPPRRPAGEPVSLHGGLHERRQPAGQQRHRALLLPRRKPRPEHRVPRCHARPEARGEQADHRARLRARHAARAHELASRARPPVRDGPRRSRLARTSSCSSKRPRAAQPPKDRKGRRSDERPRFGTAFSGVVKRATSSSSRFSVVVSLKSTGRYRAFVTLAKGPYASGYSSTIVLHAGTTTKKKAKAKGESPQAATEGWSERGATRNARPRRVLACARSNRAASTQAGPAQRR